MAGPANLRYLKVAMATATLMTVEEFAALPEDGQMHELVEGELLTLPPPHSLHSRIVAILFRSLTLHLAAYPDWEVLAAAGFQLLGDPPTVRQPDVSVVLAGRMRQAPRHGYCAGAPDLAIEVVSPSDKAADLDLKVRQYLQAGANAVAVVYPQTRSLWLHRPAGSPKVLTAGQTLELDDLLPGWSLPLDDIFAPLDELQN